MSLPDPADVTIRALVTASLAAGELAQLLDLFAVCWPDGEFSPDDVDHAMGGVHWLGESGGRIVAHASVVPRRLEVDGLPVATGYLEAVATHPRWQRLGIARRLLGLAGAHIREGYALGALSTGVPEVYAGSGWERWLGPTFVRMPGGLVPGGRARTEDDDDGVMILRTPRTPPMTLRESISCEWRPGDAW